jgi:hypothetical protein
MQQATARPSLLSRFPVMLFVPPCCSTCRLLFLFYRSFSCKTKPARAALSLNKKICQEKRSPKLYLHNASYTQPIFQRFFDVCVSAAYNWHYVLRASPNSRTPSPSYLEPKPQKSKAKVCKLRTGRPAVKKQGYINSR